MALEREYTVVIHHNPPGDGGGFVAVVPDLPGCMSDGETREEAAANAANAIREWIDEATRLGREVPAPALRVA
jgi:predicted RNase H-like HicB family nuclease